MLQGELITGRDFVCSTLKLCQPRIQSFLLTLAVEPPFKVVYLSIRVCLEPLVLRTFFADQPELVGGWLRADPSKEERMG